MFIRFFYLSFALVKGLFLEFFKVDLKEVKIHILDSETSFKYQQQPPRGVPRNRCSENMQQIYRRTPMPKCDFNKVALQLYWNYTSAWLSSCKFLVYFQNTFGRLLLKYNQTEFSIQSPRLWNKLWRSEEIKTNIFSEITRLSEYLFKKKTTERIFILQKKIDSFWFIFFCL